MNVINIPNVYIFISFKISKIYERHLYTHTQTVTMSTSQLLKTTSLTIAVNLLLHLYHLTKSFAAFVVPLNNNKNNKILLSKNVILVDVTSIPAVDNIIGLYAMHSSNDDADDDCSKYHSYDGNDKDNPIEQNSIEFLDTGDNKYAKYDPFDDESTGIGRSSGYNLGEHDENNDETKSNQHQQKSNEVIDQLQLFNSEENKYFSSDVLDDNSSVAVDDDLDEVVDFYYDPVRNKMIERKLTEKQKAKIRRQRAAVKAYREHKEQQKLQKLKVKEEREMKRQQRLEERMKIKAEIQRRKEERQISKRDKMLERAKSKASDHLGLNEGDTEFSIENDTVKSVHILVFEELVDVYLREQIELEDMRIEALHESKLFITRRVATETLSTITDDIKSTLFNETQDEQSQCSFVEDAFKQREMFSFRKALVSSLSFSDEKFTEDELRILQDEDLRRVLRIRGYDYSDNKGIDNNRNHLIEELRKSYTINTIPWV